MVSSADNHGKVYMNDDKRPKDNQDPKVIRAIDVNDGAQKHSAAHDTYDSQEEPKPKVDSDNDKAAENTSDETNDE